MDDILYFLGLLIPNLDKALKTIGVVTLLFGLANAFFGYKLLSIPSNLNLASYPMVSICVKASRHPFFQFRISCELFSCILYSLLAYSFY